MNMKDFDLNNLDFQRVGAWPTPVKVVACLLIFVLITAVLMRMGSLMPRL